MAGANQTGIDVTFVATRPAAATWREAGTAWLRPAGRADSFIASVRTSRRLQLALGSANVIGGNRAPLRLWHVGRAVQLTPRTSGGRIKVFVAARFL
jgi:hypothetical protein